MPLLSGLSDLYIGVMTAHNDETYTKYFHLNAEVGGPTGFNINNISPNVSQVYGGDQPRRVSGKGTGSITVAIGVDDLPAEVIHELIGYAANKDGSFTISKDTLLKYGTIVAKTHGSDGKAIWLGLHKGTFTRTDINPQTNQAQETTNSDALTFTSIGRSNGAVFTEFYESAGASQASVEATMFGGQTVNYEILEANATETAPVDNAPKA